MVDSLPKATMTIPMDNLSAVGMDCDRRINVMIYYLVKMQGALTYLLVPLMGLLLVGGQALWGYAIKNHHLLEGTPGQAVLNLLKSPQIWLGLILYGMATLVYFFLLSANKFFAIQITMTAVAIILSSLLAVILFDEKITAINVVGVCIVFAGLYLVIYR